MKILISDFDGTLVHEHESISIKNKEMMKKLQETGHIVVICTGRHMSEFQHDQEILNFPFDYLILNNGGHIVDQQYHTLYQKTIQKQAAIDILDHTTSYAGMWSVFGDSHQMYAYKDGKTVDHFFNNHPLDVDFKDAYHQVENFQIIAFHQDNEELENTQKCYDYIKQNYNHQVEAFFNTHFVDVVPKGCSKGTGIQILLELMKQPIESVYAIGDSYNDIPMIRVADYGYTFHHADESIKKIAQHHVNYVYEVVEDMLGGERL